MEIVSKVKLQLQNLISGNTILDNDQISQLKETMSIISLNKQNSTNQYASQNSIQRKELQNYRNVQQKYKQNSEKIKLILLSKQMMDMLNIWTQDTIIENQYFTLNQTVNKIQSFETFLTNLNSFSLQKISKQLKDQLYQKMLVKLNLIIQKQNQKYQQLKKIIIRNNLPFKKTTAKKCIIQRNDSIYVLSLLHWQFSIESLRKYISGFMEKEQEINSMKSHSFFTIYWRTIQKNCLLIYTEGMQTHNIEEPGWLFQYMQEVLNINFKYFVEHICIEKNMQLQIFKNLTKYFLTETYQQFLYPIISKRFSVDLVQMNAFLLFNFIDELATFQENVNYSFNVRADLVEPLLLQHNKNHHVLDKIFIYEENWLTEKIFDDFANINYTKVNLKNLDTFNIVVNFVNLFQRLYKKYSCIRSDELSYQIAKFYRTKILDLIANIKTSFERIYMYSKLPKIDILLSFKRIENELKANMGQFISSVKSLDEEIQKQYYGFLNEYFIIYGLQQMNSIHKKIHISLTQIHQQFFTTEEAGQMQTIKNFFKIHEEWLKKMEMLGQYSNFEDTKIRGIFFTYLESMNFSAVGFNLFIKIFEPYFKVIFNEQGYKILIMLLSMKNSSLNEYIESHEGVSQYLGRQELEKIKKFKRSFRNQ